MSSTISLRRGLTFEQIYGGEESKQIKAKISKTLLGRRISNEVREKISRNHKNRGVMPSREAILKCAELKRGTHLSEELKRRISIRTREGMNNPGIRETLRRHAILQKRTPDSERKRIEAVMKSPRTGTGKGGFREDLGHYVRSTWEANICRTLRFLDIHYEYEPEVFKLEDSYYIPDLYLEELGIYIEISAFTSEMKLRKLLEFQRSHKLFLIGKEVYYQLERQFASFIEKWDGFKAGAEAVKLTLREKD